MLAPLVPSESELVKLLGAINLKSTWGKRDYLLIVFLCHTGLRIGETTRLQVHNVIHEGQVRDEVYLSYRITKTRCSRVVPLNSVAQKCITKLLEFNKKRGFSIAPQAPLFPWKNHGYLPRREAERMVQDLREKVGIPAKVTPHAFRHFFATKLTGLGVDLPTVQSLLGHKNIKSTQRYVHSTAEQRRDAVSRLQPRRFA